MTATVTRQTQVWRDHYATARGRRWWPCEELVRFVGSRGGADGETVLEVGCGNGANLWYLAEQAAVAVGVDLVGEALQMASGYLERRDRRACLLRGNINQLPLIDGSVDGIVDVMTSQHVSWSDHRSLYAEYRRVLRPGGWLFLYHLSEGTTTRGTRRGVDPWTMPSGLPELFPAAGLTCVPPGAALDELARACGFRVQSRRTMRSYRENVWAVYHVLEGEKR